MGGERGVEGLQSPRSNVRAEDGTWRVGLPTMDSRAQAFDDGGGVGGALKKPLPVVDQAAKEAPKSLAPLPPPTGLGNGDVLGGPPRPPALGGGRLPVLGGIEGGVSRPLPPLGGERSLPPPPPRLSPGGAPGGAKKTITETL